MMRDIPEILANFRLADAADILFVALVIYAILVWLKGRTTRSLAVGTAMMALVYAASQTFDMYLTSILFHWGFVLLGVSLVVVFQEDLRRAFARLGELGRGANRVPTSTAWPEVLVDVCTTLAWEKTGALLVVAGREDLHRHLEGGYPITSLVHGPLLLSIFDAHSPGHDGAIILEHGTVTRFGVHLPLAYEARTPESMGTRHRAALGLSECSDALVLVVSEERGAVSMARNGSLRRITSADELRTVIEEFVRETHPEDSRSAATRWFSQNPGLKLAALGLSTMIWLLFAHPAETIQRTFQVPVEFRNVPNELRLETASSEVRVTLSGSERAHQLLAPGVLRLSVDVTGLRKGPHEINLTEKHVKAPSNLAIYRIDPKVLRIKLLTR